MRTKFTAAFIDTAPQGTHFDTQVPGLILYVGKRRRTWRFKADQSVNGVKKTVQRTLGELSLAQARAAAQRIRADIADGIDLDMKPDKTPPSITVCGAFEQARAVLKRAGRTPGTIKELSDLYVHFEDWAQRPLVGIMKSEIRTRHSWLTNNGLKKRPTPSLANHSMKAFRRVWNIAASHDDTHAILNVHNPVYGLIMNPEKSRQIYIADLDAWWQRLGTLDSPLRRKMHAFGLLSGLRPGVLLRLRRSWRTAPDRLTIPRAEMKRKSGADFLLPLTAEMQAILNEAVAHGDIFFDPLHCTHDFFWPSRGLAGQITFAQKPYQRELIFDDEMMAGHALRHTYRTHAEGILSDNISAALIDHAKAGAAGHYVHREAMFDALLKAQEKMTAVLIR